MITMSDFFAGAGGSSTGAGMVPGVEVTQAANHNKTAIEIHEANHQSTDHSIVDLHLERPSYFRKTTFGWFSPECTKWSQGNGENLPAIEEGLYEDPLADDFKTRSRLLMFDVLRYIDYHRYRMVIVENVVDIAIQAKYRTAWDVWRSELRALGYEYRVVSLNSMHAQTYGAPAPQSRDRIYIVAWPEGEKAPDLDRILRPKAHCGTCNSVVESVQSWKAGRTVGRYRQAYIYCCSRCAKPVEPAVLPAAVAIDWSLPGRRIGDMDLKPFWADKAKTQSLGRHPLAPKTLARIAAGIARYWGPTTLEAAGNTYDAADPAHRHHRNPDGYMRTWSVDEPLRALHTTNSKALAVPVEGRDGKAALPIDMPSRTQTTRNETALAELPFIAEMYGTSTARSVAQPAGTFTAGGNHHALVMTQQHTNRARHSAEPFPTMTTATGGGSALLQQPFVTQFRDRHDRNLNPNTDPLRTIVADGANHALIEATARDQLASALPDTLVHRMNASGAGMTTPSSEELRTLTAGGTQALLQRPAKRIVTPADLDAALAVVPEVLFRMFQPHEVAAGMAFPRDYRWQPSGRAKPISARDLVKAAGNAVTPPAARDLVAICVESLGEDIALAA